MCNSGKYSNKKPKQNKPDWSHMTTNGTYSEHLVLGKDSYNVHKNHKNFK